MTDQEIIDFINVWKERHPQGQIQGQGEAERAIGDQEMLCYCVLTNNCIKFAYEFVAELTDGVFTVPHRCCIHILRFVSPNPIFSSVVAYNMSDNCHAGHFAVGFREGGGNAIARYCITTKYLIVVRL